MHKFDRNTYRFDGLCMIIGVFRIKAKKFTFRISSLGEYLKGSFSIMSVFPKSSSSMIFEAIYIILCNFSLFF